MIEEGVRPSYEPCYPAKDRPPRPHLRINRARLVHRESKVLTGDTDSMGRTGAKWWNSYL